MYSVDLWVLKVKKFSTSIQKMCMSTQNISSGWYPAVAGPCLKFDNEFLIDLFLFV